MAILPTVLRKQLAMTFRGKTAEQIADYYLLAINKTAKNIIADFESGKSLEEIKKIWLLEEK